MEKKQEQNEQAAGLLLIAKMSNLSGDARGACAKCGFGKYADIAIYFSFC